MSRQTTYRRVVRLYVEGPLEADSSVHCTPAQSHYLVHVMRLKAGSDVELFNGCDGAWRATVEGGGKRSWKLTPVEQVREQVREMDVELLFAPVKRLRLDFLVEKATELGVAQLQPVKTRRTNSARVNLNRLRDHCIEAAEQTGRLTVPTIRPLISLDVLIANWDARRTLLFCDQARAGAEEKASPGDVLRNFDGGPWAILVGPEGGFDERERISLRAKPFVIPLTLGPRTLRADTAAIAALSLWQSQLGDW